MLGEGVAAIAHDNHIIIRHRTQVNRVRAIDGDGVTSPDEVEEEIVAQGNLIVVFLAPLIVLRQFVDDVDMLSLDVVGDELLLVLKLGGIAAGGVACRQREEETCGECRQECDRLIFH